MVLVLGLLNTIGTDGSIGHEDREESLLSLVGRSITPIFEPIGVEKDNWPASVSIFTGLFAKESVIGTMNGLYGQMDAKDRQTGGGESKGEKAEPYSLVGGLKKAFASIPENLSGVFSALLDPFGIGESIGELEKTEVRAENEDAINSLRRHFPKGVHQMYSFLLFVLLYVPCIAATGVVFREIGKLYGTIFVGYLTLLGWSVATIYHAVMVSHSSLWFCIGTGALVAMFAGFWHYGKRHRIDML
jgi:ferrous iron transport protein B